MLPIKSTTQLPVLVVGKYGQLAGQLTAHEQVTALSRKDVDIFDVQSIADAIKTVNPIALINATAYTNVDQAEIFPEDARLANVVAPSAMAEACQRCDVPLIHISTDFVFDGQGNSPIHRNDAPNPLNVYGRTKLDGELAISKIASRYVILRTSRLFAPGHENIVTKFLSALASGRLLSAVEDQFFGPTSARHLAEACIEISRQLDLGADDFGIYHFAGTPVVSMFDFCQFLALSFDLEARIKPIKTAEFKSGARRPLFAALDCDDTLENFGVGYSDWKAEINTLADQYWGTVS